VAVLGSFETEMFVSVRSALAWNCIAATLPFLDRILRVCWKAW